MPRILCFGDSNTHGTPPVTDRSLTERFGPTVRWPRQLGLGPEWEVVEDGLPGRTAQFDDSVRGDHMNGMAGLKMALMSHWPLDAMTLMLGTNDVKDRFGASPEKVTAGIAGLLDLIQGPDMAARYPRLPVLVICPPPVEEAGLLAGEFRGGAAKSRALPPLYAALARDRGCAFLDAGPVLRVSPLDGVHYDAAGHAALAGAVTAALRDMLAAR